MVVIGRYLQNYVETIDGEIIYCSTFGIVDKQIHNKLAYLKIGDWKGLKDIITDFVLIKDVSEE
jgi:hypothetical protein